MENTWIDNAVRSKFLLPAHKIGGSTLGAEDIAALIDLAVSIRSLYQIQEVASQLDGINNILEVPGCAFGIFDPAKETYNYIASSFDRAELPDFSAYPCSVDGIFTTKTSHAYFITHFQHFRKNMYQFFIVKNDIERLDARQQQIITYLLSSIYTAAARLSYLSYRLEKIGLTSREQEVTEWLVEGKDNWSIAKILGVAERTIKFHNCNIFKKLAVNNRSELIALYHKSVLEIKGVFW